MGISVCLGCGHLGIFRSHHKREDGLLPHSLVIQLLVRQGGTWIPDPLKHVGAYLHVHTRVWQGWQDVSSCSVGEDSAYLPIAGDGR